VDLLRAATVAAWTSSDARTGPSSGTLDPGDVVAAVAALDPAAAWAR
jgi:hypothetical protein